MQVTAGQIAALVNGTVEGDPEVLIDRPSKIEEGGAGSISFLANAKYESYAYGTTASALLVSNDFNPAEKISAVLIRVPDVYQALATLMQQFSAFLESENDGVSDLAFVHPKAEIDASAWVGPFAVVESGAKVGASAKIYPQVYVGENANIGADAILYPGVRIYRDCEVGDRCILHSNAVIGSDGFGFAPKEDGTYDKIPQLGKVVLESDVEIGANTAIDRATMGETRVKAGAKLDNLIQIAHNVEIGSNTVIAAQAGIAGSTRIGDQVMIGGQAGFVGHIEVANGAKIQAQSGIAGPIKEEGAAVYGSPAIPYSDYLRSYSVFRRLPDVYKRLNQLEKELRALKSKEDNPG